MQLTTQSQENLIAAERVQIQAADVGGYLVKVFKADRVGFLFSVDGFVKRYPTADEAQREIQALRPDLVHARNRT